MKRTGYLIIILLWYFTPALGTGKDTTDMLQAVRERLSSLLPYGAAVYANPALMPYARQTSLSSLRLAGTYKSEKDAVVVQQGSGHQQGVFRAESYIRLNPESTVWGNAGYRFGKIKSVRWNETSDFELLYPYVMADTAGGDLNTESYTFCGGYAHTNGRFSWGVSGDYRATIEYRKVDPRPRNVVSDLKLSGGAGYRLNQRYVIAAGIHGQIYRQRNEIRFFSDLGSSKVYQMLGLGMYSTRFSDGTNGVQYDGGSIGGSIGLAPQNQQGLFIRAAYHDLFIKRILLAHNYLPLTRLDEKTISGTIAWRNHTETREWGIRLESTYSNRKGTEFIYGDGSSSSNFPKINDPEQYSNQRLSLLLSSVWGWGNEQHHRLWIEPRMGFRSVKSAYLSPSLSFEDAKYQGGSRFIYLQAFRNSLLQASASADYFGEAIQKLDIDLLNSDELIRASVQQQYESLKSPYVRYEISLAWNCPLSDTFILSIDATWQHHSYQNNNRSDYLEIGCSLKF